MWEDTVGLKTGRIAAKWPTAPQTWYWRFLSLQVFWPHEAEAALSLCLFCLCDDQSSSTTELLLIRNYWEHLSCPTGGANHQLGGCYKGRSLQHLWWECWVILELVVLVLLLLCYMSNSFVHHLCFCRPSTTCQNPELFNSPSVFYILNFKFFTELWMSWWFFSSYFRPKGSVCCWYQFPQWQIKISELKLSRGKLSVNGCWVFWLFKLTRWHGQDSRVHWSSAQPLLGHAEVKSPCVCSR